MHGSYVVAASAIVSAAENAPYVTAVYFIAEAVSAAEFMVRVTRQ